MCVCLVLVTLKQALMHRFPLECTNEVCKVTRLRVCACVCVSTSVCLLVSHPEALSYISRGARLLSRLQL